MSNAERVAAKFEDVPEVSTLVARYNSTNSDGTVEVDFGQGPVTIYSAGFSTPLPGVGVRVVRIDGFTLMLGVVKPQPAYGVVVATGIPKLTVQLPDGTEVQLGYLSSYASPAINDSVLIVWDGGGIVVGALAEIPESTYLPPPASGPAPITAAKEFVATDSGNFYTGGSWNYNDPWSSASNTGAFFYNDIAGSIPDNANVSLVEVYLTELYNQHPNVQAKVGLHSIGAKTGNPNVRDAVPVTAGTGWKTLPSSFGDQLKTGTALGVGVPTVPGGASYHKFKGRGSGSLEGMLRITYTV